jgi:aspartate/methionine/tyrosine aminotransferase
MKGLLNDISSFIVMDILEKAKEIESRGEKVIHLEIGEPDFDTPQCIKEAAKKALAEGKTKYTHSLGIHQLREELANFYFKKYKIDLSPERIIITLGSSAALLLLCAALLERGDEVILSNPYYPCYPNFIKMFEARPVYSPIKEEEGFQLNIERIKKLIKDTTKAIFVNSPSNPAGVVLSKDVLRKIAELPIHIISDEVYHGLTYGQRAYSMLEFTDKAFIIGSFSKIFAMTGWRIGYTIVPKEYVRQIQKLQQNFFISASEFTQWAALAALKEAEEDVKKMVKIYNQRREFLIKGLRNIGFNIKYEPTGAFYVLANAKYLNPNSYHLSIDLLTKIKVATTPGIDFGAEAEGYLRFSYANSIENIEEALKRLRIYVQQTI